MHPFDTPHQPLLSGHLSLPNTALEIKHKDALHWILFYFIPQLFLITVLSELYTKNAAKLLKDTKQKNKTKCKLTHTKKPSKQFAT